MKNKKAVLAFVLIAVMAFSAYADQYDSESDLWVERKGNGIEITKYIGSKTLINIPPTIQGLPVTSIGQYAFGRTGLTSVTIPNNVTSIGVGAFFRCNSLTAITVATGNSAYTSEDGVLYTKDKTVLHTYPAGKAGSAFTIPNSVTRIVEGAFSSCDNLTSVTIPNGVTTIGDYAFAWCESLTGITIPNRVTSIGEGTFQYCDSLTSVTIPNNVTSIGMSAFYKCSSLTNVTIPNSVTRIGYLAFIGCTNLASVTFQRAATSVDSSFSDDLRDKYLAGGIGTYKTTAPVGGNSVWTKQ